MLDKLAVLSVARERADGPGSLFLRKQMSVLVILMSYRQLYLSLYLLLCLRELRDSPFRGA